MNFNLIDGYEFEHLICKLLRKMGFEVEQTSLSGDGGVDIIVIDHRAITSGKYLIQCKNWNSTIGVPTIRELYGVTISENANKGIIICTSNFTRQAIEFAQNKNLELIDYNELISLLKRYDCDILDIDNDSLTRFYDFDDFNKVNYLYLKEQLEKNRSNVKYYNNLISFYKEYVIANKHEILVNGLLDEWIELNNEIVKRFYKKKSEFIDSLAIKKSNIMLYILKGDLYKAIQLCNDYMLFRQQLPICVFFWEQAKNKEYVNKVIENNHMIFSDMGTIIIRNLLILFTNLNYEKGSKYLENIIKNYKNRYSENQIINSRSCKLLDKLLNDILNKNDKEIFFTEFLVIKETESLIPSKKYTTSISKVIYEFNLSFDDLINIYYKNINLKEELNKIDVLIDNNII